jgi:hypothetical protein
VTAAAPAGRRRVLVDYASRAAEPAAVVVIGLLIMYLALMVNV